MQKSKLLILYFLMGIVLLAATAAQPTNEDNFDDLEDNQDFDPATGDLNSGDGPEFVRNNPKEIPIDRINDLSGPLAREVFNQLTPEQKQAIKQPLLSQLGRQAIESMANDGIITPEQIQSLDQNMLRQLSPQALKNILKHLTDQQLTQLTPTQVQSLNNEELEYILNELPPNQLADFINKLSPQQIIDYVNAHPNLDELPQELVDKYVEAINPGVNLEGEGTIEGPTVTHNNGLALNLEDLGPRGWDIATTTNGFGITSNGDQNQMIITNPLNNEQITLTLDNGQSITIELSENEEFSIKLNEAFINLQIEPEGPGRLRLYSKVDGTTLRVNAVGEYSFENGILSYENQEYTEQIDTGSYVVVEIDPIVGFLCMKLMDGDVYRYESKTEPFSFSDKVAIDEYRFCVKKTDYIIDAFFDAHMHNELVVRSNPHFGYVNLITDYQFFGSLIDYSINNQLVYESSDLQQTEINNGSTTITSEYPNKLLNTGHFSILEAGRRYLKVSPELLSTKHITSYTTEANAPITIQDNVLTQQATSTITAYTPDSEYVAAFATALFEENREILG